MSDETGVQVSVRDRLGGFALDAAFAAPGRGVTALFGPSGCGKTTVLRCVAGLHRPREGRVALAGDVWQDAAGFRPAHQRPVGYVFQEASLFPHLSVRDNLLFGHRRADRAGGARAAGDLAPDEAIGLLALEPLLGRSPRHLSGGERQRVAMGRALLSRPTILLMDEPLSALDRASREEILPFLERLHASLAIPVLYVSHDMAEVERLADHLVLMEAGRVVAAGPLAALQSDPALPLLRERGAAVSLDAVTEGYDAAYGLLALAVAGGRLIVPAPPAAPGEPRRLRVQASDVSLALERPATSSIANVLEARIVEVAEGGPAERIAVLALGGDGAGARILARLTRRSWDQLGLAPGRVVFAQVKGVALAPGPLPIGWNQIGNGSQ